MSDWFVGQKVVCVTDGWSPSFGGELGAGPRTPQKDAIYVISALHWLRKGLYFHLVELGDDRFEAIGFRPLVASSNDISTLRALLTPEALVEADASAC